MRFLFLGSSGSDGVPSVFCDCPVCRTARKRGGKELRSRCCYLIGEHTMVDFGPDAPAQGIRFNVKFSGIRNLLVTHGHADHLSGVNFIYRMPGIARGFEPLRIFADGEICESIRRTLANAGSSAEKCRISFAPLTDGEEIELAGESLKFCSYPARHGAHAHLFRLSAGGKGDLLIGNDSGFFTGECWEMLQNSRFSTVILDDTFGLTDHPDEPTHQGLPGILKTIDRMRQQDLLLPDAVVIATHISHNCGLNHAELAEALKAYGVETAFDGMTLDF